MKIRNLMMSGVVLGLLAATAHANPHGGMPFPFNFANVETTLIDTNADGRISATEITAARTAEFAVINTTVADDVTFAEFSAYTTKQQTAKLTSLDTDNTGTLLLAEFTVGQTDANAVSVATEIFELADSNDDKALSAAEFNVLLPNVGGAIHQFAMLDQNYDLVVSQSEYVSPPPKSLPKRPAFGRTGDRPMMR